MSLGLAGKRILIVDDNEELAQLVAAALRRLGATVKVCVEGQRALDEVASAPPDLAVVDLLLPDVLGGEVLGALQKAKVLALAISGVFRGQRYAEEARSLGALDYFEKPFEVAKLAAAVERALGAEPAAPQANDAEEVDFSEVVAEAEVQPPPPPLPPRPAPEPRVDAAALAAARRSGFVLDEDGSAGRRAEAKRANDLSLPRALGSEPARKAGDSAAPPPEGDLARTSVPRLLNAFYTARATGSLTLARGKLKKLVFVEKGAPIFASSNVAGERLGQYCVRRGLLRQAELEEVVKGLASPQERTGDALIARGLLSADLRRELVTEQVKDIVWSTFEWRDGSYKFELKDRPRRELIKLDLFPGDLILEGIRRTATLVRLREAVPGKAALAPAPDPAYELYALSLKKPEAQLLALADGTKSVDDLLQLTELGERDALAFLYTCRVLGLLDEVRRVLASTRRIGFM